MFSSLSKLCNKFNARQFLIFITISAGLWIGIQLSIQREFFFQSKIQLIDLPKDISLPFSYLPINLKYEGTGFSYITKLSKWKEISISVSKLKDSIGFYFVTEENIMNTLQGTEFNQDRKLNLKSEIQPINYKQYYSKYLPIRPQIEIDFVPSFMMFEPIKFERDSIKVIGSQESLEKISFITTEKLFFSNISEPFSGEITLVASKAYGHLLEVDKVKFSVIVKQFSEQKMNIPIHVANLPDKTNLQIIPTRVDVFYKVPLEDQSLVNSTDFEVSADFLAINQNSNQLPLHLSASPSNVIDVWIDPLKITYMLNFEN